MPESHPILTLSWEDVYDKAKDVTQSKFGRDPTQDEVTSIFEDVKRVGMDCESGTFWATVEECANSFYANINK